MRPLWACTACRDRRKKCIRVQRGMSCTFCIKRGLSCESPEEPASVSTQHYAPLAVPKNAKRLPVSPALHLDTDFVDDIVDLFFRYYHVSFPNLFYPPSFKAAVADGSIPRIIFFGVAGLSARYSSHESIAHIPAWERGKPYVEETERLLALHDTSLTSIQACVLLGIAAAAQGEPETESVYYSIAFRMALILDLPNAETTSALDKELNIRVWWSLLTLDTWNSAGLCIPRTIKWRDEVPLPMDEWALLHDFDHLLGSPSPPASITVASEDRNITGRPAFSVLGHKVKLNLLLYEIIKLNMSVVAGTTTKLDTIHTVQDLASSLDEWATALPDCWCYTKENLEYWGDRDMGRLFMSVHIDLNHAYQLLFFQFLYMSQEPDRCGTDQISYELACEFAQKCKGHAASLSQLISDANRHPETEMLHALLGHVVSIASAVQIHNLLFNTDEGEIAAARMRLGNNFAVLTRLHAYWPNVATSFSRLEAFHKACLQEKNSSFRLGPWMLQFIIDFSRPVHDKDDTSGSGEEKGMWSLDRLRQVLEM